MSFLYVNIKSMQRHIYIIGNGISGTTAARWIRKRSDYKITVVSEEHPVFFSRTALMYVYMGHMRMPDIQPYEDWFWDQNRIDRIHARVTDLDFQNKILIIDGKTHHYDDLILAVGSVSNKFGWPGQDLDGVGGLYHLQDLKYMEAHSADLQRAVIVGGGLIGIEMAEMFRSRDIPVTMLVREESYWNNVLPAEESSMINRHILEHGIDLRLGVNLEAILPDDHGKARAVIVKETQEEISCGFVGLTAGVSPNVQWLKGYADLEIGRGILVDETLQTSVPSVYAVGDCAQLREPKSGRRPIEAVWYTGRMMGETVAYNVTGDRIAYDPGIWFNSAKFLDIEYQVYGDIATTLAEDQASLYFEHADGKRSIRIQYHKETDVVQGFNLMGVRYRHEVCERWLAQKASIHEVLQDLHLANFDPEFFEHLESQVIKQFETERGVKIKQGSKRSLDSVIQFLKRTSR